MTKEEKEKAIEYFKWWKSFNEHNQKAIPKDTIAYKAYQTEIGFYDLAIKALEQETVSKEVYDHEYFLRKEFEMKLAKLEHEKNEVIDKIRAEIEAKCCITVGRENEGAITLHDVFKIIDKYIGESDRNVVGSIAEGVQNIVIAEGMTNAEVFTKIYGYQPATDSVVCNKDDWCGNSEPCKYCSCVGDAIGREEDWWNSPYKRGAADGKN